MAELIKNNPFLSGLIFTLMIIGAIMAANKSDGSYIPINGNLTPTTRALNTAFQPSASQAMFLVYYVDATVISALAGNNSVTIEIYTSTSSGGTYTKLVDVVAQASGVLSTIIQTQSVSAMIPPSMWVKIVTSFVGPNANAAVYRYGLEYPLP